jgi:hypothetical protein
MSTPLTFATTSGTFKGCEEDCAEAFPATGRVDVKMDRAMRTERQNLFFMISLNRVKGYLEQGNAH